MLVYITIRMWSRYFPCTSRYVRRTAMLHKWFGIPCTDMCGKVNTSKTMPCMAVFSRVLQKREICVLTCSVCFLVYPTQPDELHELQKIQWHSDSDPAARCFSDVWVASPSSTLPLRDLYCLYEPYNHSRSRRLSTGLSGASDWQWMP